MQYLGTVMEGCLSRLVPLVLELVWLLLLMLVFGGHPRGVALVLIVEVEGFVRGCYGGAVGWVDAVGNGMWVVVIWCAELLVDCCMVWLFVGGGIVVASDPEVELVEI